MKNILLKTLAIITTLSLMAASGSFAAGGSIGYGDISVYKDGQLVSKLTGQNPIEDGSLLLCNSKCVIKSVGITLIGGGNAKVAVASDDDTFKIFLKKGKVDYIINSNVRKISFHTPDGTYTVADVVFSASNQPVVKGSVVVDSAGNTEISVTEGRMVFATADGMKPVDANHKIVLAFVPPAAGAGETAALLATVAADVAIVAIAAAGGSGNDVEETGSQAGPAADSQIIQTPVIPSASPNAPGG